MGDGREGCKYEVCDYERDIIMCGVSGWMRGGVGKE